MLLGRAGPGERGRCSGGALTRGGERLGLDLKILLRTLAQIGRPEERPVEDTMNIERAREKAKSR